MLNVKDKDGNLIGSFTTGANTTFAELFNKIAEWGMDGDLNQGKVTFVHDFGGYVDGTLASDLGVTTTYNTVTTTRTVGSQTTGTLKQYSETDYATDDNKLSDFGIGANRVLNVKDKDGNLIGSFTTGANTTFAELFNKIAEWGMDGDLNQGKVTFVHDFGGYVDGTLASDLGVTTTYNTVTTYTTVGSQTTGTLKQYSVTDLATDDNKLSDFSIEAGKVLNVKDRNGNILGSFTTDANSTFADMFNAIAPWGMDGDLHEGRVTFVHDDGGYVDGSLATALGVSTSCTTVTTVTTVGSSQSVGSFKYTTTYAADEDTTFAQIGLDGTRAYTIKRGSTGEGDVNLNVTGATTIGQFFSTLGEYGIDGDIHDGVILLQSDTGHYITGTLADNLGIGTYNVTQTVHGTNTTTVNSNGLVTINATDTITVDVTTTQTVNSTGSVTVSAVTTLTVNVLQTLTVNSTGSTVITSYSTIVTNITKTLDVASTGTTVVTSYMTITTNVSQTITVNADSTGIISEVRNKQAVTIEGSSTTTTVTVPPELTFQTVTIQSTSVLTTNITVAASNLSEIEYQSTLLSYGSDGIDVYATRATLSNYDNAGIMSTVDSSNTLAKGTYAISTTDDWNKLASMAQNNRITAGSVFYLTKDLYFDSAESAEAHADITIDGNGHTMYNFNTSEGGRNGLFKLVDSGVTLYIKNLTMDGAVIGGGDSAGGFVGQSTGYSVINNCSFINGTINANYGTHGGILGNGNADILYCTVKDTYIKVNRNYGGGLAAILGGKAIGCYTEGVVIDDCDAGYSHYGDMVGKLEEGSTMAYCGGVHESSSDTGSLIGWTYKSTVLSSAALGTSVVLFNNDATMNDCWIQSSDYSAYGGHTVHSVSDINERFDQIQNTSSISKYRTILAGTKTGVLKVETITTAATAASPVDYSTTRATLTDYTNVKLLRTIDSSSTLGVGTYAISSTEDLLKFNDMVNNERIDSGSTFFLTSDIDMKGVSWTSMTLRADMTIDGCGHSIKNLTPNYSWGYASFVGLNYSGLTIKNLDMDNVQVSGGYAAAGYVGENRGTLDINNCSVSGDVSASMYQGGGFVGIGGNSVNISFCSSYVNMHGGGYLGGIVGDGTGVNKIIGCFCKGSIENNGYYNGDIAGAVAANSLIANCAVDCTVSGSDGFFRSICALCYSGVNIIACATTDTTTLSNPNNTIGCTAPALGNSTEECAAKVDLIRNATSINQDSMVSVTKEACGQVITQTKTVNMSATQLLEVCENESQPYEIVTDTIVQTSTIAINYQKATSDAYVTLENDFTSPVSYTATRATTTVYTSYTNMSAVNSRNTLGVGTYAISTTDDFIKLIQMQNDHKITDDSTFFLTNDIGNTGWDTGANMSSFSGTFDGNGHSITIDYYTGVGGLFGTVDGTIKNLDVRINTWAFNLAQNGYATGVLADSLQTGEINNCNVTVRDSIEMRGKLADRVGGVAGAMGGDAKIVFTNSKVTLNYNNASNTIKFGGIVGYNEYGGDIIGCSADTGFSASGGSGSDLMVGAIAGMHNGYSSNNGVVASCTGALSVSSWGGFSGPYSGEFIGTIGNGQAYVVDFASKSGGTSGVCMGTYTHKNEYIPLMNKLDDVCYIDDTKMLVKVGSNYQSGSASKVVSTTVTQTRTHFLSTTQEIAVGSESQTIYVGEDIIIGHTVGSTDTLPSYNPDTQYLVHIHYGADTSGTVTVNMSQTQTIASTTTITIKSTGTTTISVLQTQTVASTTTINLNETGTVTVNVTQVTTLTASQVTTVDSLGYTTVKIKQTLTIGATQTANVQTLGTVTIDLTSTRTITANDTSGRKTYTTTSIMNDATKFSDLGASYNANSTIGVNYEGVAYNITLLSSNTIGDMLTALSGFGISGTVKGGSIFLQGTSDGYITSVNGAAYTLGLRANYSTSSSSYTLGSNSTGATKSRTLTYNMDGNTKINDINGLTNRTGTINVQYMGNNYAVTINGETTIDGLIGMLAGYGVEAACANGVMTFIGTKNGYIMSANGAAAELGAGTATVVSSTTVVEGTNSAGSEKKRTLTYSINGNTTIGEINGLSSRTGTIAVTYMGQDYNVTINSQNTIDSIIGMLAGYGIEAACTNGVMTFIGTKNGYIRSANGAAAELGAGTATVVSSTTVVEGTNSAGSEKKRTLTYSINGNTTIGEINGLSSRTGTIAVTYMGQDYNVTINSQNTIDSIIGMLAGYGIEAACTNGVMTFIGTKNGYIRSANGAAAELGAGTATVVSSTTVVEGTNSAGSEKKRTLTYNMDGNTKINDINGLTNRTGTINVQYMGNNYAVTINGETTIDGLIGMLAGYGVEAACANGVMTFIGTKNGYIMSANGVATELGAKTATVVSSTTVVEGTNSAGSEKARTITHTMSGTTTLGDLSLGEGKFFVNYHGTDYTVSVNSDTTIDGLIGMLAAYGVEAICSNGIMTFKGTNSGYITNATGSAATLGASQAYSTSTSQVINGENTAGTYKARTLTFNMDGTTTFAQLNLGAGTATVQYGGKNHTISMTANNTMDDFLTALAGVGITGSIKNGVMTLEGTYDGMILGTTGGIYNLGLRAAYSTTTTTTTYGSDSTSTYMVRTTNPTMLRSTKLADLQDSDGNNLGITTGSFFVYSNGVRNVETITEDTTVEDLMSTMSRHGLITEYDSAGALSVSGYNNTYLETSSLMGANSNVVERLFNQWDFTKVYDSNHLEIPTAVIEAISRDTKLSDIAEGNYQSGAVTIIKNGVQTNLMLTDSDTVGTFLDELQMFGFESVVNDNGQIIIRNTGDGVLKAYTGADQASNILDIIGANTNDWILTKSYESSAQNVITQTVLYNNATEETKLSDIASDYTGTLEVYVDGERNLVEVSADETVGSLLSKFRAMGLEASIAGGQITVQSGFKELSMKRFGETANATSKLASSGFALGLTFKDDLGNYLASNNSIQSTTTITEDVTLSVSNDAGLNTKFSLLNITDGSLTLYHDGQKAVFRIGENSVTGENIDTLGKLLTKIQQRFSDVDFKHNEDGSLLNGYLTVYSKTGANIEVGSTTDTSNFASITGIAKNAKGLAESARELYCVNNESVVTADGLFRRGNVTEGIFTVGEAIINIDSNTTLQNIVSQINSNSDKSRAHAYWDNIKGELVIEALDTGSTFVNIEAGTSDSEYLASHLGVKASNFTDIMGYTTSTLTETGGILQNSDGSVFNTRMNTTVQQLGQNAKFKINGTSYTSTSNKIESDVSRIAGVTINLKGTSEGETVTLDVKKDTETLANAVQEVVDSYNDLMENVDKAIAKGGSLATESTLKMIRNQLKNLMTSSVAGSTVFKNLDAIGISVAAATGTNVSTDNNAIVKMNFDTSKFTKAFNSDQAALKSLLVGVGENKGTGVFDKLENIVESALSSTGYFSSADKSYSKQITTLNEKIRKANQAAERYRAQLENKFKTMDMLISKMNQQYSSFLS